jgi:hypothetical protein
VDKSGYTLAGVIVVVVRLVRRGALVIQGASPFSVSHQPGNVVLNTLPRWITYEAWTVLFTTPGTESVTDVAVDARTGLVVAVDTGTPAREKKEKEAR